MQIIIIHGAPGLGKTTLSKKLHEYYKSPWFEFGWIPEFRNLNPHTEISFMDEEKMTFETLSLVTQNYVKHGFENVILSDLNDVRMLDIPIVFKDLDYIIFTFFTENETLIKERILSRDNGNTYKNWEESINLNRKISLRPALPNEYRIKIHHQTPDEIMRDIISMIGSHQSCLEYDLNYYSRKDYFSYTD